MTIGDRLRHIGRKVWHAIAGTVSALMNAIDALELLFVVLLLLAIPVVYFARCVGLGDDERVEARTTPTIAPAEPQDTSP